MGRGINSFERRPQRVDELGLVEWLGSRRLHERGCRIRSDTLTANQLRQLLEEVAVECEPAVLPHGQEAHRLSSRDQTERERSSRGRLEKRSLDGSDPELHHHPNRIH